MANYGYIRKSPKISDINERIEFFKNELVDVELFVEQGVRGHVNLLERPQYKVLDEKLQSGDTLFVWWVDELGIDFLLCINHLSALLDRGVVVRTVKQELTFMQNDNITDALVKMMHGFADSERHKRLFAAEMGRKLLKSEPEGWKQKFRGRRADEGKHRVIIEALFAGKTLQEAADESGTSLATVKRVKAKIKQHDELGNMRRRGHGHHRDGACSEKRKGHGRRHGEHRGFKHGASDETKTIEG